MATIDSLGTSILQMSRRDLFRLLHDIRAQRRKRPEKRISAARKAKSPSKSKPKSQDLFALAGRMSQAQKDKLATELLKELMS
jgi:hypothetical protein